MDQSGFNKDEKEYSMGIYITIPDCYEGYSYSQEAHFLLVARNKTEAKKEARKILRALKKGKNSVFINENNNQIEKFDY